MKFQLHPFIPLASLFTLTLAAPFAFPQEPPLEGPANVEALLRQHGPSIGWSPEFTIAGFSGPDGFAPIVYDFAQAPDGSVLATGRFRWIGDQLVDPVVRLEDDEWTPVKEEWPVEMPQTGFSAIAVDDEGATALATYSGPFGELPIQIWLDSEDDVRVIAELRGSVRSMVWFQGRLWVAGFFQLDSSGIANLAVWDGASWSEPPGGPADGAVYRLSPAGSSLLLAGDFTTVGGVPAQGVAEWNGESWQAYDLPAAHVYAVARSESGDLYAGGALPSGGVVRWNGTGWEELGGGLYFGDGSGVASDLAMFKGDLYVTGCFSHVEGPGSNPSSIPARSLARWNGASWQSLDDGSAGVGTVWFSFGVCGYEPNPFTIWDVDHQRLFSDGERLLLGGAMPGADGVASQSIVAYDGDKWSRFGEPDAGLAGPVQVVATGGPGRSPYIFGGVSHAGEAQSESGVYRYEKGEWTGLGGPIPEGLRCADMAVDRRGTVFLGCSGAAAPPQNPQPVVLRLDGEQWVPLEGMEAEGTIWDMRIDRAGRLWVAGGVRLGDATGSGFVARWDSGGFTVVEDGFNSMVFQIAFPPGLGLGRRGEYVAAGAFTAIDGEPFGRIAKWNGSSWDALGTGVSTGVLALAWGREGVYVSTETPQDPAIEHSLLGRWDGSQWIELATTERGFPPLRENTTPSFRDLLAVGRYVIAVGSVWPEEGGRNVFVYDGQKIAPLAGGVNAISVDSVALARGGLWFGGSIAEVGDGEPEDRLPSVGVARFGLIRPQSDEKAK